MNLSANDNLTKEISRAEYDELVECRLMLKTLYACGIRHWKGYDFALEYFVELKNNNMGQNKGGNDETRS